MTSVHFQWTSAISPDLSPGRAFGAQPPTPEWGAMISEGRSYITTHWWLTFFPAMAMLLAVAGFDCWEMDCAMFWIRD